MYKILILAYLITQDPIATQQTFQMQRTFDSMEDCKKELLLQTRDNGTYDVLWEFVNDPTYPKGKPDELKGLNFTDDRLGFEL